ncbi:MAG: GNAT family N-acetyltransferase [Thermoplasmata archaeon]|nr:GNAT family N-acetyltransferase [Thermoplasmata archaeon]
MQDGDFKVEIRELGRKDIPHVVSIGRHQLGLDYISSTDFLEALSEPGRFCIVAQEGRRDFAGFALCREFGPEDVPEELALPEGPENDRVCSAKKIGLLDAVAVETHAARHGVGTQLCRAAVDRFIEDGCDLLVSMAWVHVDGKEPIKKALLANGFERTSLQIPGYWNLWVDSEDGHLCPVCGHPCKCSAALWIKSL